MIPMLARVRFGRAARPDGSRRNGIAIWVPLFLVWLLLLPLAVIAVVALWVACLVVRVSPVRALTVFWQILSGMRHVDIDVDAPEVSVSIRLV